MSADKEAGPPTIKATTTEDESQGAAERPEPAPDTLLCGRYRLGRRIGKGGMGEIMAARDEQVGRDVAIKRMRAARPHERSIVRFVREASVQGRLEHPAVVPVHEIGRDGDGLPFFVMKKLAGTPLDELMQDRAAFPLQRALRAFADVCLAIELAHTRGIVHRDLKPDNIMLGDFGEVYILDWGVAKVIGEDDSDFADVGSGSGEHATGAGVAIGTPGYMAPEQVRGEPDVDGRADVYALGCVLYEILAGEALHPRGAHGLRAPLHAYDARPSARSHGREIPPELDELCVLATERDRDARTLSARALGERVQRYLDGDRDLALRRRLASEHLERARSAFAAGAGEDHHRTAMREAARAIALDPTLSGAAELVGRLMLEPPHETPREVVASIAEEDLRNARQIARAGVWANAVALAFLPLAWWIAPSGSRCPEVLGAVLVVVAVTAWLAVRARRPIPELVLIANTAIVLALARVYSPILVAPGIAASLAGAMVLTPRFSRLGSAPAIAGMMIAAVLAPMVLERCGVLSPTVSVGAAGLVFTPPGLGPHETPVLVVGTLFACALIAGACVAAAAIRATTRKAHHHLLVQAWQLRQLVPTR